jgi:hypothetical protein
MSNHPGQIRVLAGVMRPPLLDTHEATIVEFRDRFGDLNALFTRHFSDEMWIFVTRDMDEWEETLIRLGYQPSEITTRQLVEQVKSGAV